MDKTSNFYFKYPPNLQELDLATLISLYRTRGEIKKAEPGNYLGCAVTGKLSKHVKSWFGLYYSQEGWDTLLSPDSGGYPLTEAELNILGMAYALEDDGLVKRSYAEKHCGVLSKLAFMIINDLDEFGFLSLYENQKIKITPSGLNALQGICRHMYGNKFKKEMLIMYQEKSEPEVLAEHKKSTQAPKVIQSNLFNE